MSRNKLHTLVLVLALAPVSLVFATRAVAACECDAGWDRWNNPIPKKGTFCGERVCGLQNQLFECQSDNQWHQVGGSGCSQTTLPLHTKFGANSATYYTNGDDSQRLERKAARLGMGYYLQIANGPGDANLVAGEVRDAIDDGVIPIIRICTAGSCGFQNVQSYIDFLKSVDNQVGGSYFYAIAGPNEPLSENWIPGCEHVVWKGYYTAQDIDDLATCNAVYMNSVISGVGSRSGIRLLSPALNCTNPYMPQFVQRMIVRQANFNALDGIAGNGYNVYTAGGQTITKYVNDCRNAFISNGAGSALDDGFFVTEMGAFESNRNPNASHPISHSQAKQNLRNQVESLRINTNVRAALFFNGFSTSGDPAYDYGEVADHEWPEVLRTGGLVQTYWRGNQGYCRSVPILANGTIDWNNGDAWAGPISTAVLPGANSVNALNEFLTPDGSGILHSLWRGNQGFSRTIPIVADCAAQSTRGGWSAPISPSGLPPYQGTVQALAGFIHPSGDDLVQTYFRNNQGYCRFVPINSNGSIDWGNADPWTGISIFQGSGNAQALSTLLLPGGSGVLEGFWRGNQGFVRTTSVGNCAALWGSGGWSAPIGISGLPGSGDMQGLTAFFIP